MQWKNVGDDPAHWEGRTTEGQLVVWENFGVGPLTLTEKDRVGLCQQLLNTDLQGLTTLATSALVPFSGTIGRSLILHSTTTDLGAFKADLLKVMQGKHPKNYAGYTEVRSVFLGKTGDLTVGRMPAWKEAAKVEGMDMAELSNTSHYYLSEALLLATVLHQRAPDPAITQIVQFLKQYPDTVIRLYVLDQTIQIFLVWLQQASGLSSLYVDANSPEVAQNWNKKSILYPEIETAQTLVFGSEGSPSEVLQVERRQAPLFRDLQLDMPALPGYTILRHGKSELSFTEQLVAAGRLLQSRYGLSKGCLKASEAGDGARITPNIDLEDESLLMDLAKEAYTYGDDYVLESHVNYRSAKVGTQSLKLTPSAHLSAGKLTPGLTFQFLQGTSWTGNVFVNAENAPYLNLTTDQYQMIHTVMEGFCRAFHDRKLGLVIAGIDFFVGEIGGHFGQQVLVGVQDPNISFNGAEFLPVFMQKVSVLSGWDEKSIYATTWIFVPTEECTREILTRVLAAETTDDCMAMVIAVVPRSWAMIGVASPDYGQLTRELDLLISRIRKWNLWAE